MNKRLFRRTLLSIIGIFAVIALGIFTAKYFTGMGAELYEPSAAAQDGYVNVMILGVDEGEARTDTIMLAQYDKANKTVNILQIPRDTKVDTTRADKKINSAFSLGKEKGLYDAVHDIFGIKVDKYITINTVAFRKVIDEIGGVKFNVPLNMKYDDPVQNFHIDLKKGEQVLDGKKAEMLVRFRHNNDGTGYPDQDLGRMKTQREFLMVTAAKALSIGNMSKIPSYYGIFKENIKTNLSAKHVTALMTEMLSVDKENIIFHDTPGEPKYVNNISYYIADTAACKQLGVAHFNVPGSTSKKTGN